MLSTVFVGFAEWLAETHPDEAPSVLTFTDGWDVNLEPSSLALLEQYTAEYIAEMTG